VAAGYFIADGLNVGEARLVLIDAQLMFWIVAALVTALVWWRRWNAHAAVEEDIEAAVANARAGAAKKNVPWGKAEERALRAVRVAGERDYLTWGARAAWAVLCGWVFGNAISVKFTGLATPGIIAIESAFAIFYLRRAIPLPDLLLVAATSFATFAGYYAIHFALLPLSGDGDDFMPLEFKRTLIGNAAYDPTAVWPGFWSSFAFVSG